MGQRGKTNTERSGQLRRALSCSVSVLMMITASGALSACQKGAKDMDSFTTGDVVPRLQNGEAERQGATINAAAFNAKAIGQTVAPYSGFIGDLKVNYAGERNSIETDLTDIGAAAPPNFNPNETVKVDFQDASLSYILDQLLRGALGINYVAPNNLPGNITFRTETSIPKSRVIQVVRDLLARNDLVMRFVNGVFQIGSPDVIDALQANSAAGQVGNEVSRVVKLPKSNAAQVVELARQLLPQNVNVVISSASNTVVIRTNPGDADAVQRLVENLSRTAAGSDRIAIIPLRRSSPDAVATRLNEFYSSALRQGDTPVTIVPLVNQQAILAGTADESVMEGLKQLASQLDRSVTDVSELRIIPLTHMRASDIAPQLSQIFGSTVSQAPVADDSPSQSGNATGVRARLRPVGPQAIEDNEDGTGISVPGVGGTVVAEPRLPDDASGGGGAARGGGNGQGGNGGGQNGSGPFPASTATAAPAEGETRIVADDRNNAILVYSTFSVFKRMQEVVQTLDVAQAQVVIEATVVEVQLNDRLSSGVQFFLQSQGIVVGSGIPSGNQSPREGGILGVSADIGSVSVDAVLRALRAVTNLKVVSSPYLTVVDGRSARLVIGDQIPFASSTQTSNNLGQTTVTQQVEVLDTGVVLQITPRIHANNSVNLDIVQSVSSPRSDQEAGNLTPVISTRDISSQILAQSGRTVLLGGLIQDTLRKQENGVPGAARAPVIGALFRQRESRAERTELLVLITPRVVRSSGEIEAITRLLQGVNSRQAVSYAKP